MRLIDESEVIGAARRAAGGNLDRARRLGRDRPELVAYVVAATQDSSTAAKAAAWRGLELACEAMGACHGEPRASIEQVLALHERNLDFALGLGECDPRIAQRYLANTPALRQRSLLERLSDDAARSVPIGERGAVFLIVKTVVDVLDAAEGEEMAYVGT